MNCKAFFSNLSFIIFLAVSLAYAEPAPQVEGYRCIKVEGHLLWFNKDFMAKEPELLNKTIAAVIADLKQLNELLPAASREAVKPTAIWLELETEPFGTVSGKGAVYHPSAQWLAEHGKKTEMAKGVQICSAKNYLQLRNEKVGMTIVHEMAHAYYHILEKDRLDVKAAYEVAKRKGLYDYVGYMGSENTTHEVYKAYAITNAHEYFAELSEAYFGCNDYYPYNREQLKEHDPIGYNVIHRIWHLPEQYIQQQIDQQTQVESEEAFDTHTSIEH
jgi:hypothetical protein